MYRWVDHTAELELQIEAASERAVFEQALSALGELLLERASGNGAGETVQFEVLASAPDRAALLAEWMGELIFLVESEGFVPERIEQLDLAENALEATVAGRRASPPHLVKAVTYHRLDMWEEDETWRARVILDV
jgi:SHS2 domain-containing protein